MAEADPGYGTSLSIESMKVIAESVGLMNLPDDGAKELADDISYRLKILLQVSRKVLLVYPCVKKTDHFHGFFPEC